MTTRFRVQQLDGRVLNRLPQGYLGLAAPLVFNMFIGDSNFLGLDCPWSDDLEDLLPDVAFTTGTPADREVGSTMLANNWVKNSVQPSTGRVAPGRNAPSTGLPSPTVGVSRDLGTNTGDTGAGPFDLTVDPLWSLACHLQGFYEDNLMPGAATFKQTTGAFRHYGQYWIKHAISRAGFAREITTRAYNAAGSGIFDNEFETQQADASLHPDSDVANSMWTNLSTSWNNTITAVRAASSGVLEPYMYVDTVYINAMSFDVRHLGGAQMATNFRRFYQELEALLGARPNIVCVAPLIGAFEPDRIEFSTRASQLVKAQLPGAAWVDASDLALNGLNHLTGRSAVELGRRLALARQSLPDAVIRQI